jgi:inositol oxygenase
MGLIDTTKKLDDFRNYVDSRRQETVSRTYRLNHIYQTFDFVQQKKKQHLTFNKGKMSIWEAIQKLGTTFHSIFSIFGSTETFSFIDESL